MRLTFPTAKHEKAAVAFLDEFAAYGSELNGTGALDLYMKQFSYALWLQKLTAELDIANIAPGRVPALTYFYLNEADGSICGMVNLRLALNDFLRSEGGHIGYCIRPTQRGKGYATAMLRDALAVYRTLGITPVIVSCDEDNPASARVIEKNNGVLDAAFYSDTFHSRIRRYNIIL